MTEKRDELDEKLAAVPKPNLSSEKQRMILQRIVEASEVSNNTSKRKKQSPLFVGATLVISIVLFGLLIITNERFEFIRFGKDKQPEIELLPQEDIFHYDLDHVGTYVGYNVGVGRILGSIEGKGTIDNGFSLTDQIITVHYTSDDSWFHDDLTMEQKFLYNTLYLSIFVPNAKGFHFTVGDYSFSITREEMEKVLSEKLVDYPKQLDDFWDQDFMAEFMKKNEQKLMQEMIASETFIETFFADHPIIENEAMKKPLKFYDE